MHATEAVVFDIGSVTCDLSTPALVHIRTGITSTLKQTPGSPRSRQRPYAGSVGHVAPPRLKGRDKNPSLKMRILAQYHGKQAASPWASGRHRQQDELVARAHEKKRARSRGPGSRCPVDEPQLLVLALSRTQHSTDLSSKPFLWSTTSRTSTTTVPTTKDYGRGLISHLVLRLDLNEDGTKQGVNHEKRSAEVLVPHPITRKKECSEWIAGGSFRPGGRVKGDSSLESLLEGPTHLGVGLPCRCAWYQASRGRQAAQPCPSRLIQPVVGRSRSCLARTLRAAERYVR